MNEETARTVIRVREAEKSHGIRTFSKGRGAKKKGPNCIQIRVLLWCRWWDSNPNHTITIAWCFCVCLANQGIFNALTCAASATKYNRVGTKWVQRRPIAIISVSPTFRQVAPAALAVLALCRRTMSARRPCSPRKPRLPAPSLALWL